jgi:hypothetical protein
LHHPKHIQLARHGRFVTRGAGGDAQTQGLNHPYSILC